MSGVRIDRENRGKVNVSNGVPSSATKGNLCMQNSTGWLYTRKTPATSWNLVSPFASSGSYLYPAISGSTHAITDASQSLRALILDSDRCYFGNGAVAHVSDGTALKSILENPYTGTIFLLNDTYEMPEGKVTISYPKTIIGCASGSSIIQLADESANDYFSIEGTEDVTFHNVTFTRIVGGDGGGPGPDICLLFSNSNKCGLYNCNLGDENFGIDSNKTSFVGLSGSDNFTIDRCTFTIDSAITTPPCLIYAEQSNSLTISNNRGEDLNCWGSVIADDCIGLRIENNSFSNKDGLDTNVSIFVMGDSSSIFIDKNIIENRNKKGVMTTALALSLYNLTSYIDDFHVTNNKFLLYQQDDDAPEEPVIILTGTNSFFSNNYVSVNDHGYKDDVDVDIVPSKVVIMALGDRLTISENTIDATDCRCALYIDSRGLISGEYTAPGFGHRIINNDISNFSIETPGTVYETGLRNNATGIYLGDTAGNGLMPQGGVISGNTISGGTDSSAIRGCPSNCTISSSSPSVDESAQFWSIIGNTLDVDDLSSSPDRWGISIATISHSTMIGNLSIISSASAIDPSETDGNDSNEYGTTNAIYSGANK